MIELDPLDENGFIFLDEAHKPYLCRMWGDVPWLFYWHSDSHWVSLRKLSQMEVLEFPRNLSESEQNLYRKRHMETRGPIEQALKALKESK